MLIEWFVLSVGICGDTCTVTASNMALQCVYVSAKVIYVLHA